MGKISDALGKAGRGKTIEKQVHGEADTLPFEAELPESKRSGAAPVPLKSLSISRAEPESADTKAPPAEAWDERLFRAVKTDEYLPEIFKTLRSHILYPTEKRKVPRTIMVTSTLPKEGKSFISANLGISIAQGMDQHALLVNCDLRRPSLSALFGMKGSHGLVDYLRGHKDLGELIQKTSVNKLSILASGKTPPNPAELLSSSRMNALVEELSRRYVDRIIIFDSPPFQLAPESTVLKEMVDCVVLVVREGCAGRHQVKKIIETIGKEKLLGVVFNGHTTNVIERSLMKGYNYYSSQPYNYS